MTKLSVNINKIATLRNARGGDVPNVVKVAKDCERFGASGITVHPRPDERHIRYQDVRDLRNIVTTEFNIEGYPSKDFNKLVLEVRPNQVTLVPDPPEAITSNTGWDTIKHQEFLSDIIGKFKDAGIRTSIFANPEEEIIAHAAKCGTDRVELYTEPYATLYPKNKDKAAAPFIKAAAMARKCGIGLNAGHDLSLENLNYLIKCIPYIDEVSIGHALIADALYLGLEETIRQYTNALDV